MALSAGALVGNYRVERVLGRGGMGTVYGARHVEHGRQVALKLIAGDLSSDPEFAARFRREGRLQASLEHPHVVTVFEAGESEYGLYLAMRLVSESTLATLMGDRSLDARSALALLRQVADALDAAHATGLVHRDVKPHNVLVGDAGDAYLGDFGLTRLDGTSATATGKLVGTVSYLAPEVIRGADAEPASDRYAFAAMAFECLTGSVVYPRQTQAAVLYAHTSEPPPRATRRRPELPAALDEVFQRALSKDPAERPESAAALVDTVSDTLNGAGPVLGPPPPPGVAALEEHTSEPPPLPRPASTKRRIGARWLLAAALAGAAVAAGIVALAAGGDEGDAVTAPPTLPGTVMLGSDLSEPGRTLDCRGRSPHADSPGCTIVQTALPGHTLVVPEDGVIRRWGVRSARGELVLSVIRTRGEDTFQVSRSRNEFVGNGEVHLFKTDLGVDRGDVVGLIALAGSASGLRQGVVGARTSRSIPELPWGKRLGPGLPGELLLRVEYVPGGQQRMPDQVTGPAAADLEPGRVVRRERLRFASGRPVQVDLVSVGDRFVLDEYLNGRRIARIDVPQDIRPGAGQLLKFEVYSEPSVPEQLGVIIDYARTDSARILRHYFNVGSREFLYVN